MTIWGSGRTEIRFFWWRELASFSSVDEARIYVERHWKDARIAAELKSLLWREGGLTRPDKELKEEVAQLLHQGELRTVRLPLDAFWQYRFGAREPNMVVQFLGGFQRDLLVLERLRNLLRQRHGDAEFLRLTDAEILVGVAKLLRAEELIVGFRSPPPGSFTGEKSTPTPDFDAPPAPRTAAAPVVEQEKPTFANPDGARQAKALEDAARKGLPFCEECARAAAGAAN
ncbi:MAG TPA: hypothetical protein VGH38_11410 [Bryobacteraceae bacterium]